MKPEDVPAEYVQMMADAEFDAPAGCSAQDSYRTVLAAVLPAHERQVRERVAAEIEDPSVWPDHFGAWTADQAEAARTMKGYILAHIARGESR